MKISKLLSAITIALAAHSAPSLAAPSILIDVQTGNVLAAEQAFDRWSPASLTKLMTAYVTFKEIAAGNLTLKAPVRISSNAAGTPPGRMGYAVGSVMTVENALEMLIIKSANDIAVALGEAVSSTEAKFVARMNAEAKALGMTDTNFINPHGLHDPNQYTTARDFALLSRSIRKNYPQYDPIFAAEAISTGGKVTATYNLLLGRYVGADGMKTGFVCASGFNLVGSATRQGRTLISVVMGATSQKTRAEKSVSLLEQGFASGANAGTPIAQLARPANANTTLANLRSQICTEEARATRWDGRQVEGYITFNTPAITAMNRPPKALNTGLGGADGISKSAVMFNGNFIASYPVPLPKPDRPTLLDNGDFEKYGLRPGFSVPVPIARPAAG